MNIIIFRTDSDVSLLSQAQHQHATGDEGAWPAALHPRARAAPGDDPELQPDGVVASRSGHGGHGARVDDGGLRVRAGYVLHEYDSVEGMLQMRYSF